MAEKKEPVVTNRLRVQLDFVLEYGQIDGMPGWVWDINSFIVGGLIACTKGGKRTLIKKHKTIDLLPNARVKADRVTLAQARRQDEAIVEMLRTNGIEATVKDGGGVSVVRRGGAEEAPREGTRGARGEVPRVRKARAGG